MYAPKRIVFIGDSMMMPRPDDHIPLEETYPYLLVKRLGPGTESYNRARRANTTVKMAALQNMSDDLECQMPDLVIIQVGLADCAPRLFTLKQQKILERLPQGLRKRIIGFFSARREFFTRRFPKVYVKPDAFRQATNRLADCIAALPAHAIWMSIAPAGQRNASRSYHYYGNIAEYSEMIREVAAKHGHDFIDINKLLNAEEHILPDGMHFNIAGNHRMTEILWNHLQQSPAPQL